MHATRHVRAVALTGFMVFSLQLAPVQAWAADFEIDNLKLDLGKVTIAVPKISVKGSALEREAFVALFDTKGGESVVARLGRLDAAEITAGELVVDQQMGPQRQVTTYRDIRFSQIREGRIGQGESSGATISVTGAETGPMKGTMQRMSFEGFDLRQTARVLTERAEPGEKALPVLDRVVQDGYALDMGKAGRVSLGKSSGRNFAAKRGTEPVGEVISELVARAEEVEKAGADPKAERTPEQKASERKLGLAALQLLEIFDYGSGEAADLKMSLPVPVDPAKGKASPTKPIDVAVARIAYGEDTPAKSGFAVEGMTFGNDEVKGRVASYSQFGFSFGEAISELRAILAKGDPDFDTLDWRKLVPNLGTTRMEGFAVEANPKDKKGAEPFKLGIGLFELRAGEQLNGVPTSLALTIDKLTTPVVPTPGNTAARDMIAMGIKSLDLSSKIELAWDAAKNELAVRSLSLSGVDLGSFSATGTLGNVTKDIFASDLALAQVAALGATVRNLDATLRNDGLFEKLIEDQARKSKRKPEQVRQEYAMIASLGLSAILGPSDAAKTLTSAISRFAAKPGTLSVAATSKAPSGIGLADVITMTDPTEIFDKIDLKADAQ